MIPRLLSIGILGLSVTLAAASDPNWANVQPTEAGKAAQAANETLEELLESLNPVLEEWKKTLQQYILSAEANIAFKKALDPLQTDGIGQSSLESLAKAKELLVALVDTYPSTDLAVKLVSGQNIGDISIPVIEKRIRLLNYTAGYGSQQPNSGVCPNLQGALLPAMEISDSRERDATLASIARNQTRAKEFKCALAIAGVLEQDRRQPLRDYILRAQMRATLRK